MKEEPGLDKLSNQLFLKFANILVVRIVTFNVVNYYYLNYSVEVLNTERNARHFIERREKEHNFVGRFPYDKGGVKVKTLWLV
jgi:hypothetical protein